MVRRAGVVVPLLAAVLLTACAGPTADGGPQPLDGFEKVIDLIPWAKSIAADASAEQLTARIAEISAGLPSLEIDDATRTDIQNRLTSLSASLAADPGSASAHVDELNAIIDEVRAAVH